MAHGGLVLEASAERRGHTAVGFDAKIADGSRRRDRRGSRMDTERWTLHSSFRCKRRCSMTDSRNRSIDGVNFRSGWMSTGDWRLVAKLLESNQKYWRRRRRENSFLCLTRTASPEHCIRRVTVRSILQCTSLRWRSLRKVMGPGWIFFQRSNYHQNDNFSTLSNPHVDFIWTKKNTRTQHFLQ